MKIGNVRFKPNSLVLAPMEDVTHQPFRLLCKEFGADWVYSEFVAADALIRKIKRSQKKISFSEKERPFSIQLYGKDVEAMREAAQLAEEFNPDFIDINFGCPVKKIAQKGAGAGLLKDIPRMLQITKEVVRAVNIPVTVKTRLSWDKNSESITTIAEKLQDVGIQALTIHGRTRCQLFREEADWSLIGAVKNNSRMKIPIIGNGDVDSAKKAKYVLDTYNVDAIMIGRAAIGCPWIFKEIKHYLATGEKLPSVSISEQIAVLQRLIKATVAHAGEIRGVLLCRKHLAKMFKGLPNFKQTRIQMLETKSVDTLLDMLNAVNIRYGSPSYQEVQNT